MFSRLLGWICALLAITAIGGELLLSVREGGYESLSLADIWRGGHAASFIGLENLFLGTPLSWLWDPVLLTLLACPAWILLAAVAALLFHWGRRRRQNRVVL